MISKNTEYAGSGENKKNVKGKLVLALKTKKRTTKGKIEFIAHCNEIRIKGELFF